MVVETRDCTKYEAEYGGERKLTEGYKERCAERPVHRYIRMERFKATLTHFIGGGKVPVHVIEVVEDNLNDNDPETMW